MFVAYPLSLPKALVTKRLSWILALPRTGNLLVPSVGKQGPYPFRRVWGLNRVLSFSLAYTMFLTGFGKFANASAKNWRVHSELTLEQISKVIVIYYENLRENPVKEMRRVAEFLQLNSTDHQKNFERRLICMQLDLTGNFRRSPRNFDFDPFAQPGIRRRYEDAIEKANETIIKFNHPALPSSYL